MRKNTIAFRTCFLVLIFFAGAAFAAAMDENAHVSCPPGTLYSPVHKTCALVNDLRESYKAHGRPSHGGKPPDLVALRNEHAAKHGFKGNGMPVPGGLGAGIGYNEGALQALDYAELSTVMYVHPKGVNPSAPLSNLYTTATNRTEKTIEFLAWYSDSIVGSGALALWDWSCSAGYPCAHGETGPSFVWSDFLENFPCNMAEEIDPVGNQHTVVQYDNLSQKLDAGSPPLWVNKLYLWNYCNDAWDFIYSHEFRADQKDCSTANECGWWGPIFETFDDPEPEVDELGFENTALVHDQISSILPPTETAFTLPGPPWELFFLDPNRGFGAGNHRVTYSLSGTVKSSNGNGRLVSGATVSIAGITATTSKSGAFLIAGIPAGHYALTVAKTRYRTYTENPYFVGSDQDGLNFVLTRVHGRR